MIVPAVTTWEVSGRKQIRIEGFETIELIGMEGDAVKAKIIGTAETTEYSYDNNGNLTSIKDPKGITTLEYDYENRLTKFTKPDGSWARFTYDPFGRRYSKETSTGEKEIYLYDGLHILEIYDGNTMQLKSSFIHSDIIDEVLFGNIQGQDLYYHQDGLNSVKALTDGVGNVVTSYDYDAWGNPVGSLPAIMNPFTFTGREWDKETGLYYYRARYYDAKVGRFVSKDPIGLAGGDINLYSYVGNNPVRYVDPLGLLGWDTVYKFIVKQLSKFGLKDPIDKIVPPLDPSAQEKLEGDDDKDGIPNFRDSDSPFCKVNCDIKPAECH